jgi:uncharacterized membrane protein
MLGPVYVIVCSEKYIAHNRILIVIIMMHILL